MEEVHPRPNRNHLPALFKYAEQRCCNESRCKQSNKQLFKRGIMGDTFHLFSQIRKRVKKSNFKPDSEFIKNAVKEFKNRGGVIKKVAFCNDECNLFN